jgi:hypothetical protein
VRSDVAVSSADVRTTDQQAEVYGMQRTQLEGLKTQFAPFISGDLAALTAKAGRCSINQIPCSPPVRVAAAARPTSFERGFTNEFLGRSAFGQSLGARILLAQLRRGGYTLAAAHQFTAARTSDSLKHPPHGVSSTSKPRYSIAVCQSCEGDYGAYIEDLKRRKGVDADQPHRIK